MSFGRSSDLVVQRRLDNGLGYVGAGISGIGKGWLIGCPFFSVLGYAQQLACLVLVAGL